MLLQNRLLQNFWGKLSIMAGALLLTACATTDDPHQGGFFSGVQNLATGGYQQRIDSREQTLQQQYSEGSRLSARADTLRAERDRNQRELAAASSQVAQLEASLNRYRASIRRQHNLRTADRATLTRSENELSRVKAQLKQAEQQQQVRPVEDVRSDTQAIQQRLTELSKLVEGLGGE
jgi:chromosome segregation ATPase